MFHSSQSPWLTPWLTPWIHGLCHEGSNTCPGRELEIGILHCVAEDEAKRKVEWEKITMCPIVY